jgi:polyphosphate glucokinase
MESPAVTPTDTDDPYIPAPGTRLAGAAVGIDVGGTGVKAAVVDLATASLLTDRIREKTPQPATPEAVTEAVARVVGRVLGQYQGRHDIPVGCGLPGVVKRGVLKTAANIDTRWIDWPAETRITEALGQRSWIINDADAAGLAEIVYGAGEGRHGTVILLTIGTGIGSALFIDGMLVPNTEFGHLQFHGRDAETLVSGASRVRRGLGWKRWTHEFNEYLAGVELYFWPDLFIFGGGVSKEWARWGRWLQTRAPVVTATHLNTSGIIGAAYAAAAAHRVEHPHADPRGHGSAPSGDGAAAGHDGSPSADARTSPLVAPAPPDAPAAGEPAVEAKTRSPRRAHGKGGGSSRNAGPAEGAGPATSA